jgi:hypothetical protein
MNGDGIFFCITDRGQLYRTVWHPDTDFLVARQHPRRV